MKTIKMLLIAVVLSTMVGTATAQDGATYVDEMSVQDSSYMEDLFMEEEGTTGKSNTLLYVGIAVVVVAGAAFFLRKKKK